MHRLLSGMSSFVRFIVAQILAFFMYDKEFLKGKYFAAPGIHVISAVGWKWVVNDGFARIFLKCNQNVPWPVSYKTTVTHPDNIEFSVDDLHIFQNPGIYFQAIGAKIIIGEGTWIAPNVGLITSNHNMNNLEDHLPGKDIVIGKSCWIGMNSMILPGVVLGDRTIVGAGSIVTKSFPEGDCVIAGNPAKVIRKGAV